MAYYSQQTLGPYEEFRLGDFGLDCGTVLPNATLAYEVHGKLNKDRSNAILFPVMFSGASKHMEHLIGPGMALDPDRYFIVVPNQLGNGLSSSPHNTTPPFDGPRFPLLSIHDDIRAQKQLLDEHFGIKSLELVLGWSMGAQQTYAWAINHPEMVKRAAPIGGTAVTTPHDALFVEVFCEALRSDSCWKQGGYEKPEEVAKGLTRLAHVFALMGLSAEFYRQKRWEQLGFDGLQGFLTGFWEAWFAPMDPNNLLAMAGKWLRGDLTKSRIDVHQALKSITAKVAVISFDEDMFIRQRDCEQEQALIPGSTLRKIQTLCGHFAMLGLFLEDKVCIDAILKELLATPV